MSKLFLFNIQGTTTDPNFFSKVLVPYSRNKLVDFITNHKKDMALRNELKEIQLLACKEMNRKVENDEIASVLMQWMDEGREIISLDKIQNLIWDLGYSKNQIQAHLFDDVKPFFIKIINDGGEIGIFSSIPIHAQKLIFSYSPVGDITPLISYYFDTRIGGLEERTSFCNISNAVHYRPEDIHFFSASPKELIAAESANYKVIQVNRLGTSPSGFKTIHDFNTEML